MTTYRVKVGFHNPTGLTFRQLDEILEPQRFWRTEPHDGKFRYYMEYEYESDVRDLCEVCELAYSQACKVRKCPLILVEAKTLKIAAKE
ncbi:hypothetical protein O3W44_02845 [Pantoea sp. LMR881]|uniref:hypothetical protein n=1 Tax=Pantoea sp. LMR881 TaxID=3014336 RepID=UPI0022B073C7|nr:hypothetical protein [Pantoea sp. LMR881]MCZ4058263.1 hypothetical protein [Pantoea sp. LMR881]